MKDFAINVSFVPYLNVVQCTMPTADYDIWLQDEGKLVTALSEKIEYGDTETTITLSLPWFEVCKRYIQSCYEFQPHEYDVLSSSPAFIRS